MHVFISVQGEICNISVIYWWDLEGRFYVWVEKELLCAYEKRFSGWILAGERGKGGAQVNFTISFFISKGTWIRKPFLGRICLL